jgi:PAS domain S-box-containing protein
MPDKNLRLLILDDSPEDRTVVRFMLEETPRRTWEFLDEEKGAAALARLKHEAVDCILLDYHLPDMNAVRFLRELTQRFGPLRFPVVVFTGSGRASLSEQVLLAGAQDYLSKDMIRADNLVRAIDNSIKQVLLVREQQKQSAQMELAKDRLRMLEAALRQIGEPVLVTDGEITARGPRIVFVNPAFSAFTGYSEADVIGRSPKMLQGPKTSRDVLARLRRDLVCGRRFSGRIVQYRKDGSEFTLDLTVSPVRDTDGRTTHFIASHRAGARRESAGPKSAGNLTRAYEPPGESMVLRSAMTYGSVCPSYPLPALQRTYERY